jgi:hypothetical protein
MPLFRIACLLLVGGINCTAVLAQPAVSIQLGRVTLTLGMDQPSALQQLTDAGYRLEPIGGSASGLSVRQEIPPQSHGSVYFADGRVQAIDREWGYFTERSAPTELFRTIHSAVTAATAAEGRAPTVSATTSATPSMSLTTTSFKFGTRSVDVIMTEAVPRNGSALFFVTERVKAAQP